jgi:hypothetical protein
MVADDLIREEIPRAGAQQADDARKLKAQIRKLDEDSQSYALTLQQLSEHILLNEQDRVSQEPSFTANLSAQDQLHREAILKARLISSFRFEGMPNRHEAIPAAHHATFQWVFKDKYSPMSIHANDNSQIAKSVTDPSQSFLAWLESPEKLYWITGKPGAGKSTLMKFLANHDKTIDAVRRWVPNALGTQDGVETAADHSHCILRSAAYFFWNAGSSMQKSKLGLCQTLLYHLFEQDPDLVQLIFPARWERYQTYGSDRRRFAWSELWQGLLRLLDCRSRKFLLFIDGLDEIDEKPAQLASLILELSKIPMVKVCAASRPWLEFEDPFRSVPRLQVEELTRPDIHGYITGRFGESPAFEMLELHDPQRAAELVQDVTNRASGVFLWVYVVAESLLEGLRDGDSLLQLEQRLHELPTELDDLFTRILKQVPPRYAEEASELFQFVRKHPENKTIGTVWLAQQPVATALHAQVGSIGQDELDYSLDCMRRRIYSRCKCLLQVNVACNARDRVDYLHRTVRDYLFRPQNWDGIRNRSPTYDPDAALAIAILLRTKQGVDIPSNITKDGEEWELNLILAISFISRTHTVSVEDKVAFLDEVNRVRALYRSNGAPPDGRTTWSWGTKADILSLLGLDIPWKLNKPLTMFEVAFGADLNWYIEAKLTEEPKFLTARIDREYPLSVAIEHDLFRVAETLLKHGADPNRVCETRPFSSWFQLLRKTQEYASSDTSNSEELGKQLLLLSSLFLDKGASPRSVSLGLKPERAIEEILTHYKGKEYQAERDLLSRKFEQALRRDKEGRRLTFKGIRS